MAGINVHRNLYKKMKNIFPLLFLSSYSFCFAQSGFIIDTSSYKWIHPEFDSIQFFQNSTIAPFYKAWKSASEEKLVIVYMGDSHVQPDILPGEFRKKLQAALGNGGRGMVFPYSTANTYSSMYYKSTHKGKWTYAKSWIVPPKMPLGVSGMTSKTTDAAANFTINFYTPLPDSYTKLRIYCKKEPSSFDIKLDCGGEAKKIIVDSSFRNNESFIEVDVPPIKQTITLGLVKNQTIQTEFEFYGLDIMSTSDTGVVVHCVGVGASRFQAVLYEELLDEQLPGMDPDLVILDYGTNDYLYDDSVRTSLEEEIKKGIKIIRTAAPGTTILLTTTQDMLYKYRKIHSGIRFSDLIRNIAKEDSCLFFDWFWISGGYGTIKSFQQKGLAQADGVHLTMSGYTLKGDVLAQAFMNTMKWLDTHPDADSLVLNVDSLKNVQQQIISKEKTVQYVVSDSNAIKYKIKKGDNLGSIARRYGVTVAQLKVWNNLYSDMIIAGKYLLIYKN